MHHLPGEIILCQGAGIPRDLNVTEPMISESGLPGLHALSLQNIAIRLKGTFADKFIDI